MTEPHTARGAVILYITEREAYWMRRSISLITVLCLLTGILNLTAFAANNNRAEDWSLTRLSTFGDASQQYSVTQVQDGVQFTALNDTFFTNNNQADIADINAKVRLTRFPAIRRQGSQNRR